MLLAVYALVALVSTSLASPTPSYDFKQVSRAEVVRRIKRGVRARAPLPSSAGGAPDQVFPEGGDGTPYVKYYTGRGAILSANPSGEDPNFPSVYTSYPGFLTTDVVAQQCAEFAYNSSPTYYGTALWFDESNDRWQCRVTNNQNRASDFTAVDANARPVYGYNLQSGG